MTKAGQRRFFTGCRSDRFFFDANGIFQEVQSRLTISPFQAVFLAGGEQAVYVNAEPPDDDPFIGVFAQQLEHTGAAAPEIRSGFFPSAGFTAR